jgi:hypothetical protein
MQPSGDHQVQHQPQIAVKAYRYAFSDAAQRRHNTAVDTAERRVRSPEQEGTCDTHLLETLTENSRFERADVGGDVGQFRHESTVRA